MKLLQNKEQEGGWLEIVTHSPFFYGRGTTVVTGHEQVLQNLSH